MEEDAPSARKQRCSQVQGSSSRADGTWAAEGLGTPTPTATVLKDKTRALVQSEQVAPWARGQGTAGRASDSPAPGQGTWLPAPIRPIPLGM